MSKHNKKGYRTVKARDPRTGQIHNMPVEIGSPIDRAARKHEAGADKAQRKALRQFKDQLKIAKKAIPADQRAKVNWNEVRNT